MSQREAKGKNHRTKVSKRVKQRAKVRETQREAEMRERVLNEKQKLRPTKERQKLTNGAQNKEAENKRK